jgi:hypothetical protein
VLTLVVIPALYYLWRRRGLEGSTDDEPGGQGKMRSGLFDRFSFTS